MDQRICRVKLPDQRSGLLAKNNAFNGIHLRLKAGVFYQCFRKREITMKLDKVVPGMSYSCIKIVLRVGLGCLFLYGSLPKIQLPFDFLDDVYAYELVGPKIGLLVAMVLPWFELYLGICLIGGVFVGGALLACIGIACMFAFVISWALYNGLNISCGCFGSHSDKIDGMSLTTDILLILTSVVAYYLEVISCPREGGVKSVAAK